MEGDDRGNSSMPTPNERKRDPIYSPDQDEDGEYELEPPDAEVIAAEERRAREAVDATRVAIDIDKIYREVDRDRGGEILNDWIRDFRGFRFQTKHLLIATAVLAIVLALWRLDLFGTAFVIFLMLSVAGAYFYLSWQESKQQQEAERRIQEMYARNRDYHEKLNRAARPLDAAMEDAKDSTESDVAGPATARRPAFQFRFSLGQLLLAMTAAGIVLGIMSLLGGPANTATILGFLALVGLVIHAFGIEPPELVILIWWMILVLYVLLSIAAVVLSGFA
jgi:Ca2+/Na+ antiporter